MKTLFTLLSTTGEEEAAMFLSKDPYMWEEYESYQQLERNVQELTLMVVVNDRDGHGIALIEKYNECLTRDEDQKQFILRFVKKNFFKSNQLLLKRGWQNKISAD